MYMGHSSSRGILIGDTARPAPNAVYGCWRNGKIVLEKGEFKEPLRRQDQEAEPDDKPSEEQGTVRRVFGVMGLFLVFSAGVWVLFGFTNFLAALVFSVLAYFPVMVIVYARRNPYQTEELHQQFRRFHGCEHACVKLLSKNHSEIPEAGSPVWLTLQNLQASPIYDAECGTVYAGYFLTLTVEIGLFLSTFVEIDFLKAVGILLATIIVLFILIFVPWNPYKRLQYPAVAQPGEKEYELGLAVLEKYIHDIRHIS